QVHTANSALADVVPLLPLQEPHSIPAEVEILARKTARGALEVLSGTRPLQHMARVLDSKSYERLHLRANLVRSVEQRQRYEAGTAPGVRLHRNIMIRAVRVCPVSAAVFEAAVIVAEQKRVRAVALRIERRRGQWRATELEVG
ncbi:Rv3235 family protein, partial [Arthrobacter sp. H5]|uniref:Rv3235 family protein n=1 Tax=Arthrobacter sp. H5 TaxID=1267973 RepID=UPI000684A403